MNEQDALSPLDATDKLFSQFSQPTATLEVLTAQLGGRTEAIAAITSLVATSFCSELPDAHAQHGYLVSWHLSVRADCTRTFARLRESEPSSTRESLNQSEDLQILNGIRRGVHRAVVTVQRQIQPKNGKRRVRLLPDF